MQTYEEEFVNRNVMFADENYIVMALIMKNDVA